ncbi:MAG: PaaI family thioesterase [Actinomycetota bacterium]|nr:PaaI family thioesterase [Actinomycetota bacterium]
MTNEPGIESAFDMGALSTRMGMKILEARPGRVVATMPVEGNTQPYGTLHGGASAALAESVGSIAAWLHGGPDSAPVGLDLSCTHHRAVSSGRVTGVATPLSEGRTVASYDIRITDDAGRLVSTARLTCLIQTPAKAGPEATTE